MSESYYRPSPDMRFDALCRAPRGKKQDGPNYHGTIVRYLADCREAREITGRNLANASALLERLKPGHPALKGSLIAMLGAKHADAITKLGEALLKDCEHYLKRASGRIHLALSGFLRDNPHHFALKGEWDWQVISQILQDYPPTHALIEKELREKLAEKLPATIAKELADRARQNVFTLCN